MPDHSFSGEAGSGLFRGEGYTLKAAWDGVEVSIQEFVQRVEAIRADLVRLRAENEALKASLDDECKRGTDGIIRLNHAEVENAKLREELAGERERCAKIAEAWELEHYGKSGGGYEGEAIAELIRGG